MFWSFDLQTHLRVSTFAFVSLISVLTLLCVVMFQVLPLIDWTLVKKSDMMMVRVLLFEVIGAILDPLTECVNVLVHFLVMRLCFYLLTFQSPEHHISHSSRQRLTAVLFHFLSALASSLTLSSESGSDVSSFSTSFTLCHCCPEGSIHLLLDSESSKPVASVLLAVLCICSVFFFF